MTELQRCSSCRATILLETYFAKNRKGQWFKTCNPCRERQRTCKKKFAEEIKERENTPEIKVKHREAVKKWRDANPEFRKAYEKKYRDERRHHCEHNVPKTQCKVCCPSGYLKMLVSARIREALKTNKSKKSYEYLGCDIATFRTHLESTFLQGKYDLGKPRSMGSGSHYPARIQARRSWTNHRRSCLTPTLYEYTSPLGKRK